MSEYRKDALDTSEDEDEEIIGLYDKELHQEMLRNTELHNAEKKGIESRNIEIAKAMLKENLEASLISKITGLSIEEIKNISEVN